MKQEEIDRLMNSMQKAKRIFNNRAYQLLEIKMRAEWKIMKTKNNKKIKKGDEK